MQTSAHEVREPVTLRTAGAARVGIGHALVDDCTSRDVCGSIINYVRERRRPAYVITPNAQHIVLLNKDERFRNIYNHADLILADGVSLLFAAKVHGRSLQERVAGVDVFRELCGLASEQGLKVFLMGGRPGSAELAAAALRALFPKFECDMYCPPIGFEQDPKELEAVAEAIKAAQPHLVFVGLGAPKQEYWIYDHGMKLSVPVMLGVGGSFELVGGVVPRAPQWVQHLACEWLYRLAREPKRMWRRYLIGNLEFADIILRQRARRMLLDMLIHLIEKKSFGAELREMVEKADAQESSLVVLSGERRAHSNTKSGDPIAA